ncbi:hypothetical protein [Ramlibacter sp.]|uniref:hypothetical protein n=1 Tax=Ramlibacter sp. TaxID=1917967 RepID=UPI002605DD49|nr:hypothetical protein [Ramlibacter sp.]MDB5956734.1 hypothetical protein [Ramlibacter sp.]
MPGIDASIPLGAKLPDQMQSLSSLLNVARGVQDLKTGAQNQQIGQQTLQQNQQATQQGQIDLQERQALQPVLTDPSNYTAADGSFDPVKAQANIMKAAPTTGTKYLSAIATAHKQGTEAQAALNSLTTDDRKQVSEVLYSAANSPPEVVEKLLDTLGQQYKGMAPVIEDAKSRYRQALAQGPDAGRQFITQAAQAALPPQTQQDVKSGSISFVNTKDGVQPFQTKVGAATPVGPVGQPMAPPNQFVNTPTGRLGIGNPATGEYTEPQGSTPPVNFPVGENADSLKAAQNIRTNANNAARSVPDQQFNANQIIKLADETDLGKGSQYVANLKGAVPGLHWTSDKATNYNQVGHYLALQTAQLAQASGLGGTDAAHAISAEQAGDRQWTPDALKTTSRVNRALSTGADLFNRGVENAIQAAGSPIGARNFQNKWSQVANVDALRVYDAYKNRTDDPEGWKAAVTDLGGPTSAKFKKTMQDVDAMRALVRGK